MLKLTRPEGNLPGDLDVSRRALGGLFFAGYAVAAASAQAEPITTPADGLITETVMLPTIDRPTPAFIARPDARGRFPVVVVVSEVFGIHEYIRDTCRRLARLGYVALAPDFFARHGDPAPLTDFNQIRDIVSAATEQEVMNDLQGAVYWLSSQPFVNKSKMAVTGFCWGGAVVWLACSRFNQFKSGVAWYGRLSRPAAGQFLAEPDRSWPLEEAGYLKAPVLGLYAGKDRGIPANDIEAMRVKLREFRKSGSDIVVYPEAQHGFHADYRASYDAAAAQDGWRRMIEHLDRTGVGPKRF